MTLLIICALFCAILSLAGGLVFFVDDRLAGKAQTYALPFAAGTLLACAFFDLLPEAVHYDEVKVQGHENFDQVILFVLIGFLLFLILDCILNLIYGYNGRSGKETNHVNTARLMIICDVVHTVLDGIVIGAAFLAGPMTGIISTVAILSHELPQEIGEFAILLNGGFKKKSVIIIQFATTLLLIPAGVFAYILGERAETGMPEVLAATAGFFIYIAACEIIPVLFKESESKYDILRNILLLLSGIAVIGAILSLSLHSH